MMTKERFKRTNYKMSYEEYMKCYCGECDKTDCIHRNAYRRIPKIDGGRANGRKKKIIVHIQKKK